MDKNGNRDPLCRHEVHYAEKTLGVCISIDGNDEAEMTCLKDHSKLFVDQIRISKCSKNAALYTYNSSFVKSMEYAMPVTQFSEIEWNRIVTTVLEPSLQKAESKNNRQCVLYGPDLYQGFQVMHPYFNKEFCHIMTHLQESVIFFQTR